MAQNVLDFLIDMAQYRSTAASDCWRTVLRHRRALDSGWLRGRLGQLYAKVGAMIPARAKQAISSQCRNSQPARWISVLWFFAGLSGAIPPALLLYVVGQDVRLADRLRFQIYALADVARGLVETLARRDG
ncbi:MAG: hypothetical protein HPM95_05220 [Alphaproteobacteria bacterium]|nr:hypothetical protein [Alphaproteobacteria bacterium]